MIARKQSGKFQPKRCVLAFCVCFEKVSSLQHHTGDPYELSNEDEEHGHKDSTKTYRYGFEREASAVRPRSGCIEAQLL